MISDEFAMICGVRRWFVLKLSVSQQPSAISVTCEPIHPAACSRVQQSPGKEGVQQVFVTPVTRETCRPHSTAVDNTSLA